MLKLKGEPNQVRWEIKIVPILRAQRDAGSHEASRTTSDSATTDNKSSHPLACHWRLFLLLLLLLLFISHYMPNHADERAKFKQKFTN